MSFIDTLIVGAIVIFFLFVFYSALKEPLDLLFGAIKSGIIFIIEKIREHGSGSVNTIETIRYG